MYIDLFCPHCPQFPSNHFTFRLIPKGDCFHEVKCPQGHTFTVNILYHEFQQLFEEAIYALVDNYYREAISSFAASYERFMEFFMKIILKSKKVDSSIVEDGWKKISKQSERQLGAFIFLYISEFGQKPNTLKEKQINLRNKVIHQGYFPAKDECILYGNDVLNFIRDGINLGCIPLRVVQPNYQ